MTIIETLERPLGYKIRISVAEIQQNPREEFESMGTFVLAHKRYNVANETEIKTDQFNSWDDVEKEIIKQNGPCVILPVYMYDHSGVALSTARTGCFADQWDSGVLGLIFVSNKTIRETYGVKRVSPKVLTKTLDALVNEVEVYGAYLNGDVFEFEILDAVGNVIEDSCMGSFYGWDHTKSGLIAYAEDFIKQHIKRVTNQGTNLKEDAVQLELELTV